MSSDTALSVARYGKEEEPSSAGDAVVLSKQEAPDFLHLPEAVPLEQGLFTRPKRSSCGLCARRATRCLRRSALAVLSDS